MKSKFNINLDYVNKKVPHTYWLPKLYMTLQKAKFIVATAPYFMKPLFKAVTFALKILDKQIGVYHTNTSFF